MSDELRAAAERLRFMEYDSLSGYTPLNTQYMKDLETIRELYLAEHPADDGEPANKAWARQTNAAEFVNRFSWSGEVLSVVWYFKTGCST